MVKKVGLLVDWDLKRIGKDGESNTVSILLSVLKDTLSHHNCACIFVAVAMPAIMLLLVSFRPVNYHLQYLPALWPQSSLRMHIPAFMR